MILMSVTRFFFNLLAYDFGFSLSLVYIYIYYSQRYTFILWRWIYIYPEEHLKFWTASFPAGLPTAFLKNCVKFVASRQTDRQTDKEMPFLLNNSWDKAAPQRRWLPPQQLDCASRRQQQDVGSLLKPWHSVKRANVKQRSCSKMKKDKNLLNYTIACFRNWNFFWKMQSKHEQDCVSLKLFGISTFKWKLLGPVLGNSNSLTRGPEVKRRSVKVKLFQLQDKQLLSARADSDTEISEKPPDELYLPLVVTEQCT